VLAHLRMAISFRLVRVRLDYDVAIMAVAESIIFRGIQRTRRTTAYQCRGRTGEDVVFQNKQLVRKTSLLLHHERKSSQRSIGTQLEIGRQPYSNLFNYRSQRARSVSEDQSRITLNLLSQSE
jgi:hypothetical protein